MECIRQDDRSSLVEATEAALLALVAAFEAALEMQESHYFVEEVLAVEHHALEAVLGGCLSSDPLYQPCTALALLSLPLLAVSALAPVLPVASDSELVLRFPSLHLVQDAPVLFLGQYIWRHLQVLLDSSCCLVHRKTPCAVAVVQSCQDPSNFREEHFDGPWHFHNGFWQLSCL